MQTFVDVVRPVGAGQYLPIVPDRYQPAADQARQVGVQFTRRASSFVCVGTE